MKIEESLILPVSPQVFSVNKKDLELKRLEK